MLTHEAGPLHSPGHGRIAVVPAWLKPPSDGNALIPELWPSTAHRNDDGVLVVGGVDAEHLAAQHGTPAYVVDEEDFRARAAAFRNSFHYAFADICGGADVYYAAKAFLCTEIARWLVQEGLRIDTCSAGELTIALRAGVLPESIALHGNNKSDDEILRALEVGVGRIVVDSIDEIERVADISRYLGVRACVMLRVTVGVEAHTHEYIATAHDDQKFGIPLSTGAAAEAVDRTMARRELSLLGLHSHIGSQIFDSGGFELATRRLLGLHAEVIRNRSYIMPELCLGGGFGIAYTSQDSPLDAKSIADSLAAITRRECEALGIGVPRISVEPGRAIAGPSTLTLYRVGTVKDTLLEHGLRRRYLAVDGGMSDNIRPALYDADYSCTVASRASAAPMVLTRVVGKHCESGDILVKDEFLPSDVMRGDLLAVPGTGAYCRSMASQYNLVPRPPVIATRNGTSRVIVRRETENDVLALDVMTP